ncbi:DUF1285 domain-containing protein [Altererythrobacter aerius]|uniref:DUF1285 domain-containing protein n=1 Tax=Tsuneonella aeria TaxID=1837929 RepID=A0A6I4TD19_9SPHN|nr:DUF1285 domain-containing protein [Tsuneonella aeria]MXO74506.1 DUF1285 domain-containing protein [Tsuneonella aeria]
MPYDPPPEIAGMSLAQLAEAVGARRLPPIEQWNPAETGDSHMAILADGSWTHEGGPITRPAMVRAFAALLMRDGEGHWLVTPVQKLRIAVADAAFVATDVTARDGALAFRLNTDEIVIAGPGNPIAARGNRETPAIYLSVRNGCEARLNRSTWEQLALMADAGLAVTSKGTTFSLVPG